MRIPRALQTMGIGIAITLLWGPPPSHGADPATVEVDGRGVAIVSADGQYALRLRGYAQFDGRFFAKGTDNLPAPNAFLIRRLQPIVEYSAGSWVMLRVMPEFGDGKSQLEDGYMDLRFGKAGRIRAGRFKVPLSAERMQSASALHLIERSLVSNLTPNRDIGVLWTGDAGLISYDLGLFNGAADGASLYHDADSDKEILGRIILHPWQDRGPAFLKGLAVGVGGTTGRTQGAANLPSYRTSGQLKFFSYRAATETASGAVADGARRRLAPQISLYGGRAGGQAEFVISEQEVRIGDLTERLQHQAWQVSLSVMLTRDARTYRGVNPHHPFSRATGAMGALELVGRLAHIQLDDDAFPAFADPENAARRAFSMSGGVRWHLDANVTVAMGYEETRFDGGGGAGDRDTERLLWQRLQVSL
ncbi:MAG: OprO/OprP family phosphate-selective porin [Candidatus Eisenbacteria bacterium]|uniref:OprO/OprP family phosphate-selective porin n=1 Tax=Eiseniibacteriota bacterium TaxID=2212470 RepID=A0A948RX02_UNCEI|nr:OprO/OprP family phosphate-selective porin [Candidatus Eisenbacteria bacterium]MBU1949066.1 OprO/OprP family phosphate-selective porin [Candidatus Eisenbacteria bacterium]MBU2691169.1 OprO/OprP family phosphate-selective porin [Candidatus Eisenbacteria bacterium]